MADDTHSEDAPAIPAAYAWCAWHDGYTDTARLISAQETVANGRGSRFACAPCRTAHRLVPAADWNNIFGDGTIFMRIAEPVPGQHGAEVEAT
ncbi:hypothetical protein ACFYPC_08740 [Streptomyces sp. NPDC005808]|uniref:hypothetical protein n=1 Tax=Streptomyces sp. NPDC005808 TaxID=3364734 RepID=UPI0036AD3CE7